MDNQHSHPLLAQVALTKSPFFNPPKPITLPSSYKSLPLQVPETHVTKDNLEAWIREIESVKSDIIHYGESDRQAYDQWQETVVKKLAPGYIGGGNTLLIPQRKLAETVHEEPAPEKEERNDIDRAFSTLNI